MLFFCPSVSAGDLSRVSHVSDGDTLVLENGKKIRLIGVDAPEMSDDARNRQNARRNGLDEKTVSAFANKARNFTKRSVENKSVRLEYDWQRTDKYGRTLAYVYRQEDGFFLNAEIIREGFGFSYPYFPFRYSEDFRRYGEEARQKKKGLWASQKK